MSRAIVPHDLVGDPHDLWVRATIDGTPRQDTRTNRMLWHVGEIIEHRSAIMSLQPGDLILTGSPEELPLAPGEKKGLAVGQVIVCEAEKLGRLENRIGEQTLRQPNESA